MCKQNKNPPCIRFNTSIKYIFRAKLNDVNVEFSILLARHGTAPEHCNGNQRIFSFKIVILFVLFCVDEMLDLKKEQTSKKHLYFDTHSTINRCKQKANAKFYLHGAKIFHSCSALTTISAVRSLKFNPLMSKSSSFGNINSSGFFTIGGKYFSRIPEYAAARFDLKLAS